MKQKLVASIIKTEKYQQMLQFYLSASSLQKAMFFNKHSARLTRTGLLYAEFVLTFIQYDVSDLTAKSRYIAALAKMIKSPYFYDESLLKIIQGKDTSVLILAGGDLENIS